MGSVQEMKEAYTAHSQSPPGSENKSTICSSSRSKRTSSRQSEQRAKGQGGAQERHQDIMLHASLFLLTRGDSSISKKCQGREVRPYTCHQQRTECKPWCHCHWCIRLPASLAIHGGVNKTYNYTYSDF